MYQLKNISLQQIHPKCPSRSNFAPTVVGESFTWIIPKTNHFVWHWTFRDSYLGNKFQELKGGSNRAVAYMGDNVTTVVLQEGSPCKNRYFQTHHWHLTKWGATSTPWVEARSKNTDMSQEEHPHASQHMKGLPFIITSVLIYRYNCITSKQEVY